MKRIGGFRDEKVFNLFKEDCAMWKKDSVIWDNINAYTHGNPCECGCKLKDMCNTYKRIVMKIHSKRVPIKTNRMLAKEMNTTSRQISKMRREGKIA